MANLWLPSQTDLARALHGDLIAPGKNPPSKRISEQFIGSFDTDGLNNYSVGVCDFSNGSPVFSFKQNGRKEATVVSGVTFTEQGALFSGANGQNIAWTATAGNFGWRAAGDQTIIVIARLDGWGGSNFGRILGSNGTDQNWYFRSTVPHMRLVTDANYEFTNVVFELGKRYAFVYRSSGGSRIYDAENGRLLDSVNNGQSSNARNVVLGNSSYQSLQRAFDGQFELVVNDHCIWSDAKLDAFIKNPYGQIYAANDTPYLIPAAASGGTDFSGTAGACTGTGVGQTATANITSSIDFSGTAGACTGTGVGQTATANITSSIDFSGTAGASAGSGVGQAATVAADFIGAAQASTGTGTGLVATFVNDNSFSGTVGTSSGAGTGLAGSVTADFIGAAQASTGTGTGLAGTFSNDSGFSGSAGASSGVGTGLSGTLVADFIDTAGASTGSGVGLQGSIATDTSFSETAGFSVGSGVGLSGTLVTDFVGIAGFSVGSGVGLGEDEAEPQLPGGGGTRGRRTLSGRPSRRRYNRSTPRVDEGSLHYKRLMREDEEILALIMKTFPEISR